MMDLQREVVEQVKVIDKALAVIGNQLQAPISMEELGDIIDNLDAKSQINLYRNLTKKHK